MYCLRFDLHSAVNLRQIAVGDHLRWLETDANLETSRTPINKLNGTLGFEGRNSPVCLFWPDISPVKQASSHVFAITGVAFHHLVGGLEARHCDFLYRIGFVGGFLRSYDRSVSNEGEMNTRVWYEVGLELVEIDVERPIEAE